MGNIRVWFRGYSRVKGVRLGLGLEARIGLGSRTMF